MSSAGGTAILNQDEPPPPADTSIPHTALMEIDSPVAGPSRPSRVPNAASLDSTPSPRLSNRGKQKRRSSDHDGLSLIHI